MNENKNCAQEIWEVKVPQLALPPTGPRLRLKVCFVLILETEGLENPSVSVF